MIFLKSEISQSNGTYSSLRLSAMIVLSLASLTKNSFASGGSEDQIFVKTPDIARAERTQGVLGVDKVDSFSGALRVNNEDIRLRNGSLDIVVQRSYTPNMTYTGLGGSPNGYKSHPFSGMGIGGGWSFAIAPKVIIRGDGKIATMKDKLCTLQDWSRTGLTKGRGPNGEKIFATISDGDVEYEPEALNFITNYTLQHANGQLEALVPTDIGVVRSGSGWKLTCSGGAAYTLHGPDGSKYELNQLSPWHDEDYYASNRALSRLLQATRISDANSNFLTIDYLDSFYPSKISSSDGSVFLSFTYDTHTIAGYGGADRYLREVTDQSGRSWKYLVQGDGPIEGEPNSWFYFMQNNAEGGYYLGHVDVTRLKEVQFPDGTKWSYEYWPRYGGPNSGIAIANCFNTGNPSVQVDNGSEMCQRNARSGLLKSIRYPTGGVIQYTYMYAKGAKVPAWPWEYYYDDSLAWPAENENGADFARFTYTSRVKSRTLLSTGEAWNYDYQLGNAEGQYDTTTITTPNGIETYKHIGAGYFNGNSWAAAAAGTSWPYTQRGVWKYGLLMEKTVGPSYKEVNEWTPLQLSGFWPDRIALPGYSVADPNQTYKATVKKRTVTSDGANYVREMADWDIYGNPGTISETGPNGGGAR